MNFSLLFGLCVINLIHGKYLLVDVDGTQNNPIEPNGNRCAWPPCYPPPRIDVEDTQNPQREPNENRCRPGMNPPCIPSAPMEESKCFPPRRCIGVRRMKDSACVPLGNKCESTRQCCSGGCVFGICIIGVRRYEGKNISVLRKQHKILFNAECNLADFEYFNDFFFPIKYF